MTNLCRTLTVTAMIILSFTMVAGDCQARTITLSQLEHMLRSEVRRWHGTPYSLGGTSKRGIDCSAFVRAVIENLFDATLPRYSGHQARVGQHISRRNLRTGDLVFFRTGKGNHVGLYLGRLQFAHACKSRGVTISNINGMYWRANYWTARRIFR